MVVTFLENVKSKFKVVPIHTIKTHTGTRNTVFFILNFGIKWTLSRQLSEHRVLRRIFGPKTEEGTGV
jgi:hypothetical protein